MTIELKRAYGEKMAQSLQVRTHSLIADVSAEEGGADTGPSPHDLYDAALAACKALTVMWYANKKGIKVDNIHTVVERDDSQERAGVYKLAARLQIIGDLTDAQLRELSAVAQKCPVHKLMTTVTTEITTSVEKMA
ncbi:MAG: OsmC family protein [Pseudomonadota bacterium]